LEVAVLSETSVKLPNYSIVTFQKRVLVLSHCLEAMLPDYIAGGWSKSICPVLSELIKDGKASLCSKRIDDNWSLHYFPVTVSRLVVSHNTTLRKEYEDHNFLPSRFV
jgi:hypothetical protein